MTKLFITAMVLVAMVGCQAVELPGEILPKADQPLSADGVTIGFVVLNSWCDHMPLITQPGEPPPRRQYLQFALSFKNESGTQQSYQVKHAWLSLDKHSRGQEISPSDLTVWRVNNEHTEKDLQLPLMGMGIVAAGKCELFLDVRARPGLFDEDNHEKTIFLTLRIEYRSSPTAWPETLRIRGSGRVAKTS